jgi:hypothetical protein
VDFVNRGWDYLRVGGWRGLFPRLELQKGGYAGLRKKDSDWLGSQDWAPYQGSMDGKVRPVVQQGFDLLWVQVTISTECKKESGYSLFREGATNVAGKEPIEALTNL